MYIQKAMQRVLIILNFILPSMVTYRLTRFDYKLISNKNQILINQN